MAAAANIDEQESGAIDHLARGLAREAVQAIESFARVNEERWTSHRRENEERWSNQRREWEDARRVMQSMNAKMDVQHAETRAQIKEIQISFEVAQKDNGAAVSKVDGTYNSRFWQLAVGIIVTLVSVVGVLLAHDFLH